MENESKPESCFPEESKVESDFPDETRLESCFADEIKPQNFLLSESKLHKYFYIHTIFFGHMRIFGTYFESEYFFFEILE